MNEDVSTYIKSWLILFDLLAIYNIERKYIVQCVALNMIHNAIFIGDCHGKT